MRYRVAWWVILGPVMSERGDVIDQANDKAMALLDVAAAEIRYLAQHMQTGEPGYCIHCGRYSVRLVGCACAPCRDHYKLP
jgi:hypothetical protein